MIMDEKYIENLGGSSHVDEGMWDRLKSRASGFTQAAKNLAGKGASDVDNIKLNSLFKKFLKNTIQTLSDFQKVIVPYERANRLTPDDETEYRNFLELKTALQGVERLPVNEANVFTRPFSTLGAIASGQPPAIINAYKKQIEGFYNTLVNDVKKMNLVPDQYVTRKLASLSTGMPNVLDKLGVVLGKSLTSQPPVIQDPTTEPPAPETPEEPSPVAPATPEPPAEPSPVAPAEPAPETQPTPQSPPDSTAQPDAKTPSENVDTDTKISYYLTKLAIDKMALVLSDTSEGRPPKNADDDRKDDTEKYKPRTFIGKGIAAYYKHMNKAVEDFPTEPRIEYEYPTESGEFGTIRWFLRWRNAKPQQFIEYYGEKEYPDPENPNKIKRDTAASWTPFMKFNMLDLIDQKTLKPKETFNVLEQISNTDSTLRDIIKKAMPVMGEPENLKEKSKTIAKGLAHMLMKQTPQPAVGDRERAAAHRPEREIPVPEPSAEAENEPEQYQTTTGNVQPKDQGRVGKVGGEPSEKATVDDEGNITYQGKTIPWHQGKKKEVLAALGAEDLKKYRDIYNKKRAAKKGSVKENVSYRDFFQF